MLLHLITVILVAMRGAIGQTKTGEECATGLDCHAFADMNGLSGEERLNLVSGLNSKYAKRFNATDNWNNIVGVIQCFRDCNVLRPNNWWSYVDDAILEGIERGVAIATNTSQDTFGNPGSEKWARFLTESLTGLTRAERDHLWSEAEQTSTAYGCSTALDKGLDPGSSGRSFYLITNVYRWLLRNRPDIFDLVASIAPDQQIPFYDWLTDVTQVEPTYYSCVFVLNGQNLNLPGGLLNLVGLTKSYIEYMFKQYQSIQQGKPYYPTGCNGLQSSPLLNLIAPLLPRDVCSVEFPNIIGDN